MKQLICTVLLLAANLLSAQQKTDNHEWKVTIKVVDENSSPVPGARAGVGYYSNSTPASIDGLTDADGVFEASHSTGPSLLGYDLGIEAEKNGYYAARRSANLKAQYDPVGWSPTINLLLKKVGKPIPMYAKREETKVQKEDEPVGFDLVAGDWVAPYGTGRNGDMLFTVHRKVVGDRDYEAAVKLAFPNKGDGIAVAPVEPDTGSVFKTSRTAADTGYEPERVWHYSSSSSPESVFGYFFRVRTVLDDNGNVKTALYGKTRGDIRFYVGTRSPRAGVGFDYFLNPAPNDRNVEFDPSRNLLRGLQPIEQLKEP